MSVIVTEVKARSDQCFPVYVPTLQGTWRKKTRPTYLIQTHCKYSKNSMT